MLPRHIGKAIANQFGGQLHARRATANDEGEVDRSRVERDAPAIGVGRQVDLVAAGHASAFEIGNGIDGGRRGIRTRRVVGQREDIIACPAGQHVPIQATDDLVVASATDQHILAQPPVDHIIAAAAGNDIIACAASNDHGIGGGRCIQVQEIGLQL